MTYKVSTKAQMQAVIVAAVEDLRRTTSAEMLIMPLHTVTTKHEAVRMMLDAVSHFDSRYEGDELPEEADGHLCFHAHHSVDDNLRMIENEWVLPAQTVLRLTDCLAPTHVSGKTRCVRTPMGEMIIDLERYSRVRGLPLERSAPVLFPVFFFDVPDKNGGDGTKLMLVAVRWTKDSTSARTGNPLSLEPLLQRMQAEARAVSDPNFRASFHCPDVPDGWQLLHNPLFRETLSWNRGFYWYVVRSEPDGGGLQIPY